MFFNTFIKLSQETQRYFPTNIYLGKCRHTSEFWAIKVILSKPWKSCFRKPSAKRRCKSSGFTNVPIAIVLPSWLDGLLHSDGHQLGHHHHILDKVPRHSISISISITIFGSFHLTLFVSSTNSIQIVRQQVSVYFQDKENGSSWIG